MREAHASRSQKLSETAGKRKLNIVFGFGSEADKGKVSIDSLGVR